MTGHDYILQRAEQLERERDAARAEIERISQRCSHALAESVRWREAAIAKDDEIARLTAANDAIRWERWTLSDREEFLALRAEVDRLKAELTEAEHHRDLWMQGNESRRALCTDLGETSRELSEARAEIERLKENLQSAHDALEWVRRIRRASVQGGTRRSSTQRRGQRRFDSRPRRRTREHKSSGGKGSGMTKAYKLTVLIVDHDNIGIRDAISELENARYPNRCIMPIVAHAESTDLGEWHDDHAANRGANKFLALFPDPSAALLAYAARLYKEVASSTWFRMGRPANSMRELLADAPESVRAAALNQIRDAKD
jgi:hypothetical protein